MEIQRFADVYDEMINDTTKQKQQVQNDINNLAVEKQNILDTYEKNYQEQLGNYENLMNQQQNYIDTWANTQKDIQQKQTDYNIGLINQNKKEAEKQTNAEIGNAYIDYQKGLNQFGGSAETLASQGLGGTGFAKNQDIAMNITYQNRISSAKSALQKANTDYNNQIQQALLNNDAALAEIALKQMQQSYALALQGFEYKSTMQNNRTNYIQGINDSYFSKANTLQNRLDSYNSTINSLKAAQQDNITKLIASSSRSSSSSRSGGSSGALEFTDDTSGTGNLPTYYNKYQDRRITYNRDALGIDGQVDKSKVFSNGYQPNNINGKPLKKAADGKLKVGDVFNNATGATGVDLSNQYIWQTGGKYYIWDGSVNSYQDVTTEVNNYYKNKTEKNMAAATTTPTIKSVSGRPMARADIF